MKNKKYFLKKENSDEVSKILKTAIDVGIWFQNKESFIKKYKKEDIISLINEPIPSDGIDIEKLLSYFNNNLIDYCINQANTKYLSFPDAWNSVAWYVADILKPLLNQNLIADIRSAPLWTYLEITLIKWIRELIWYNSKEYPKSIEDVGWVYCFWGVMSIVTGLLIARSKLFKWSFSSWILDTKNTYVLCPQWISHYSVASAMWYLWFWTKSVIEIPLKSNFKMDEKKMEEKINNIINNWWKILAIVAYAWDSRTMRIDNLEKISNIAIKYNIWLHVDACHWWALLFSSKQKYKIKWIEKADSITLDPHKVLSVTYPSSLVLFKNSKDLLMASKSYDMTIEEWTLDLWQISPFIGSKSFESLKLWFLIKNLWLNWLSKMIDKRFDLVHHFYSLIEKNKDFYNLHKVNINSLCFLYFPTSLKNKFEKEKDNRKKEDILKIVDNLNKKIQEKLYENWIISIHSFKLNDEWNKVWIKNFWKRQVLWIIIWNDNIKISDMEYAYKKIINFSNTLKY